MPRPDAIRGGINALNRPFIKLDMGDFPDPVTAFIDTGFNGSLIVDAVQAERVGLDLSRNHRLTAILASQRPETFFLCRGQLDWLGELEFISAFVIDEPDDRRRERRGRKRNEEVVLGVELLLRCRLEIDFVNRTVFVARQA